jgi:histone-lysine N-methyltransferase SETMAR
VIKYVFLRGNLAKSIYDMLVTLGDKCSSYSTIRNLVAVFRTGHLSNEVKNVLGDQVKWQFQKTRMQFIPRFPTIKEYTLKRHHRPWSLISKERAGCILRENLDIRKLSAKWIPKGLNADQKRHWMLVSWTITDQFWQDPVGFFNHLIAMDEIWIHIYEPQTKEQSKEWRHNGFPHPN